MPAAESTFLSVIIWSHHDHRTDYEVAEAIEERSIAAEHQYCPGSPPYTELKAREAVLAFVIPNLDDFDGENPVWWEYYPALQETANVVRQVNET